MIKTTLRKLTIPFISMLLLMAGSGKASSAQETADQILINGKVLTVDDNFSVAEAIAIKGDRLLAVGSNNEIITLSGPNTKVWDVEGRTVIPGLIDNHVHYLRSSPYWKHEVLFDGVTTRADAVQLLKDTIAARASGEWIMNIGGWDIRQFTDSKQEFSKAELDGYAPDNPVFIQYGFKGGYGNTPALELISAVTVIDPSTQTIDTMTGYVYSGGETLGLPDIVRRALPSYDKESWKTEYLATMNRDYNKAGITCLWNSGAIRFNNDFSEWAEEYVADNGNWSGVRMFHHIPLTANNVSGAQKMAETILVWPPLEKGDYFRYQALAERPYGPTYDLGSWNVSQEDLDAYQLIMEAVAEVEWQTAEHMIQSAKYGDILDIWEDIDAKYEINPLRWSIHHCDGMNSDHIKRAKALNCFLAMHVGHIAVKNQTNINKPPFRTAQEIGIEWGLGTDAKIVSPYQAFVILYVAVTGKSVGGSNLNPDQYVSREEALIAYTRSNAWYLHMDDHLGTLEKGKYADVVVLDKDYMTCAEEEIRNIHSVLTLIGGKVGYKEIDATTEIHASIGLSVKHTMMEISKNPITGSWTIHYTIEQASHISLAVYDMSGRRVAVPVNAFQKVGNHSVTLNTKMLANDVYFVTLKSDNQCQVNKILVVK